MELKQAQESHAHSKIQRCMRTRAHATSEDPPARAKLEICRMAMFLATKNFLQVPNLKSYPNTDWLSDKSDSCRDLDERLCPQACGRVGSPA